MSDLWWHNLPQCNVGDLVKYKSVGEKHARKERAPWLVIEVKPEKPCRVNPSQIVTVFDSASGRSSKFDAKNLEVISEDRRSSQG